MPSNVYLLSNLNTDLYPKTIDNTSMARCWKNCTYIVSNSIRFVLYDDVFDPHLEMFLDLI